MTQSHDRMKALCGTDKGSCQAGDRSPTERGVNMTRGDPGVGEEM